MSLMLRAENDIEIKMKQTWRWHEFSQTRGLPSNRILQLSESNSGTMYVLTDKGIAWYNGYYWHKVHTNTNFNYSNIGNLQNDLDSGLTFIYENTIYRVRKTGIQKSNVKLDTSNYIYSMPYFYSNDVMFAFRSSKSTKTEDAVVIRNGIELSLANYCNFNEKINGKLKGYYASNNSIFLYTDNNLYHFNGKDNIKIFKQNLPKIWIYKIHSTNKGVSYIVVGYPTSLRNVWKYDANNNSLLKVDLNQELFVNATSDKNGNYYYAMRNGEISYHDKNGKLKNLGFINQYVNDSKNFIFDIKGNLWVSSDDRIYLCNLNENRWNYNDGISELKNKSVNKILRSKFDNTLWVASGDGLYNLKDGKVIKSYFKIGNVELKGITALEEDNQGRIWIGSGGFFDFAYYLENGKWYKFGLENGFPETGIHNIKRDRKGRLWFLTINRMIFGTGSGAICIDNKRIVQKYDETNGLFNSRVYNFIEDKNGAYWFATYRGLHTLQNGTWKTWTDKSNNNLQTVYALVEDKDGKIWFGGDRGSIRYIYKDNIYVPSKFVDKITTLNNLLIDDKNRLWILGSGLHLYSNNDKELLISYTKNAGFKSNFAWTLLYEKDSMMIGSFGNGFTTMYLNYNTDKFPKVFISEKLQNGNKYILKVAVASYYNRQNTEDILIRYKIDNEEWSDWSIIRNIELNNLSSGKHTISLQAANFFGEVENKIYKKEFIIEAPFYLSPNYLVPIFVLIVILIWSIFNNYKRKQEARKEILALNLSLENKVAEQTAELTQAYENLQLLQYQTSDALEEEKMLNEMKSAFISSVSHEYRTPLTVILSSTYLIEKFVENGKFDRIIDSLNKIRASVSTLTKFVDDSLTMNETIKQGEETKTEEFSLNRIITNVLEEIPNKDPLGKIIYPLNIDYKIKTNYLMLKNILSAIVSNSIKFNKDHNTINIDFSTSNNNIVIKVIDRGIGMTNEDLENMYSPFYRSKNVIGLIEGTGLGLSIAKRSADEIGARIECSSELGAGTVFSVILPK